MRRITTYLLIICGCIVLCQCKTKKVPQTEESSVSVEWSNNHQVFLLDSIKAAAEIVTDQKDLFFDRVTLTEISLQLRKVQDCDSRSECLQEYKEFLKSDVESFTESEIEKVKKVFENVGALIAKVNPALIDRDIKLIKTKGKHYGDGVFYTRENKIVIPQNVLDNWNEQQFTETMLHEFFHIFSRYNPESREKLYSLIGFKPVEGEINFGDLDSRKLLNPDGTTHYYIQLGDQIAYPLISSTEDHFIRSKPTFFNYLAFHLYELKPNDDMGYTLGEIIPFEGASSFFEQIKDNTDYILHADEIMADNFIYTIYYLANNEKIKKFSGEGQVLIDNIGEILINHK